MADKTGRCLCGAVTFTAKGVERHVHACHCGMCRRWAGGPGFVLSAESVAFEGECIEELGFLIDVVKLFGGLRGKVQPDEAVFVGRVELAAATVWSNARRLHDVSLLDKLLWLK